MRGGRRGRQSKGFNVSSRSARPARTKANFFSGCLLRQADERCRRPEAIEPPFLRGHRQVFPKETVVLIQAVADWKGNQLAAAVKIAEKAAFFWLGFGICFPVWSDEFFGLHDGFQEGFIDRGKCFRSDNLVTYPSVAASAPTRSVTISAASFTLAAGRPSREKHCAGVVAEKRPRISRTLPHSLEKAVTSI